MNPSLSVPRGWRGKVILVVRQLGAWGQRAATDGQVLGLTRLDCRLSIDDVIPVRGMRARSEVCVPTHFALHMRYVK